MIQHARGTTAGHTGPQNPSRAMSARSDRGYPRSAFTLVELLVVMVVIAILAGISLGALNAAREGSRVAKTKATIAKIDRFIMTKYESYRSRGLPMGREDLENWAQTYYSSGQGRAMAYMKMNAVRDLIRMEMPDRWNDVVQNDGTQRAPLFLRNAAGNYISPTLATRYWAAYDSAVKAGQNLTPKIERPTIEKWGPAECLYQIVATIPGAVEEFHENEIGDIDSDGLREFHDAWGKPILFIRWPAGFIPSRGADTDLQTEVNSVDPFDPRQLLQVLGPEHTYALYPLIYSAGPDGVYDMNIGKPSSTGGNYVDDPYFRQNPVILSTRPYLDPYQADGAGKLIAQPIDADPTDGDQNWHDNIHNHRLDGR